MSNMTVVNGETREVVLTGLEAFVDYNISVRAFISVEAGPYSIGIIEMTNEDSELVRKNACWCHYFLTFSSC
jgi:hypothetical protein